MVLCYFLHCLTAALSSHQSQLHVSCNFELEIDSLRKHVWKLDWIGPVLNLTTRSCCRRKLLLCAFTQTVWSWWNWTWKPQQPEMLQQSVLSTVRVLGDEMTKVPRCCRYLGNSISSPRPLAQFTKCCTKCSRRHLKTASPRSLWHAVSGTQTCGQKPQYHDTTKASKVGWTWKRGEVFSNSHKVATAGALCNFESSCILWNSQYTVYTHAHLLLGSVLASRRLPGACRCD